METAATPAPIGARLPALQRTEQHKLGGFLLRLQQYELLLKAMVANTQFAGLPAQLESLRDAQIACAQKKTLGGLGGLVGLVGMLTAGYLSRE